MGFFHRRRYGQIRYDQDNNELDVHNAMKRIGCHTDVESAQGTERNLRDSQHADYGARD